MDLDAVWCPVCSRLVEPKRTVVPIRSSRKSTATTTTRSRGGLVHGTGRVRPCPANQYRVIIDPSPLPLYCSDECRRQDGKLSSVVTDDKLSSSATSDSSSTTAATTSSSSPSPSSASSSSSDPSPSEYTSPSVAVLAKLYHFPPPPPPAPPSCEDSEPRHIPLADNGLIMVGRYLQSLVSKPPKPQAGPYRAPPEPPKTIPGWNDGSHAWRSCLYNLSVSPPVPELKKNKKTKVSSRLGDASMPIRTNPTSPPDPNSLMLNKYAESLGRPPGTISPASDATIVRRERSLLPPGAQGKLLVPDVKLKVRTGSSIPDDSPTTKSTNPPRRPAPESRSWSYDNLKTYDLMPMPSTKEKRTKISIVDGSEVRVEYEVDSHKPLKRLFLFPSSVRASP
ncbi:hypothetical protein Ac2012v2_005536 [Leucoagaricus gongylophorus]